MARNRRTTSSSSSSFQHTTNTQHELGFHSHRPVSVSEKEGIHDKGGGDRETPKKLAKEQISKLKPSMVKSEKRYAPTTVASPAGCWLAILVISSLSQIGCGFTPTRNLPWTWTRSSPSCARATSVTRAGTVIDAKLCATISPSSSSSPSSPSFASSDGNANSSSTTHDRAARFHVDMHRVLESKRHLLAEGSSEELAARMDRRKRPPLLSWDVDGANRVAAMLNHMLGIGVATEESYQILLRVLLARGRLRWFNYGKLRWQGKENTVICAADEASWLMEDLWARDEYPSTETCNLVLNIFGICATPRGERKFAEKAQQLLDSMEHLAIPVTVESFIYVVRAWAWQQENLTPGHCANNALKNFERMMEFSPPDHIVAEAYSLLVEAFSKSSSEGSAEKAEEFLQEELALKRENSTLGYPLPSCYTNAIVAWTKKRSFSSTQRAQHILDTAIKGYRNGNFPPDTEPELMAFNSVIAGWAREGRVEKAEAVLKVAEDLKAECKEFGPDVKSYNSVLRAYMKCCENLASEKRTKESDIKHKKHFDKLIDMIDRMESASAVDGNLKIKPDSYSYWMVLRGWLSSDNDVAPIKAVEVVDQMVQLWEEGDEEVGKSNHYHNIAINALAKAKTSRDPQIAYDLLLRMQRSETFPPDIITYTSVIECFAKSTDPRAASISLELLQHAEDVYEETSDPKMMPNHRIYTMTIHSLCVDPVLDNVVQARRLLKKLCQLYEETQHPDLQPNAYPFNYLLNCAGKCSGSVEEKIKAFKIATKTYSELRESSTLQIDTYTYNFWFKCCNNLLPIGDLRSKALTMAFKQCTADGLLGPETLSRFLRGSPQDLVVELLDLDARWDYTFYGKLKVDDFPPNWSRNVR